MNAIQTLLTVNIDIWTAADTGPKSGRGRSSGNADSVYGIKKLRELILELAVRGKLVPQVANDEPASELLKRIQADKAKLLVEGKIKKDKPLAAIADEEKPFELPNHWLWVRLGEITNFGVTEKLNSISDDTWVLDLEDIEKDTSKLLQKFRFSERRSLSDKNSFQAGDVLYGKLRPYLNKVVVADEEGVCTTEILPIRCYGSFDSHYFKVALKSPCFVNYVNARSYGMKMPRLGTDDGRKACFPLPPLAEQHRIVAKVEELMALCDQLEAQHNNAAEAHEKLVSHLLGTLTQSQIAEDFSANWQRIAVHFDTLFTTEASIDALKQTLLQLAVMGKLVPQDANEEPSISLLKRKLAEKANLIAEGKVKKDNALPLITDDEKPFGLPTGWTWVRLQDLLDPSREISYGVIKLGNEPKSGGIHTLRCSDVKPGFVDLRGVRRVSEEIEKDYIRTRLIGGEILLNIRGTLGGVALVEQNLKGYNVAREIAVIPISGLLSGEYLVNVMRSIYFWNAILDGLRGIAYKGLNLGALRLFPIPLPPISEQHRIVAKVSELMALCDELKIRITQSNQLQQKLADVVVEQAAA
jgi:type I restriction enzyme, S subunit